MAHPNAITIQPLLLPFDFCNDTLAFTPLPNRSNKAVPINSGKKAVIKVDG